MKEYPSITTVWRPGHYHIYKKLDGSNIRVEWNKKQGFNKWGRRHGLLDDSNPILKRAPPLFLDIYSVEIEKIMASERIQEATFFMEFWGPNSFAGNHLESEEQTVTLFDISVYKKGFLKPKEFEDMFRGKVPLPEVTVGPIGANVLQDLKSETGHEGYVLKSANHIFKAKTFWWLEKLKGICKTEEEFKRRA